MAGRRAHLMATDWPYGVRYDGGNHPPAWTKAGRRISSEQKTSHWDDYRDADELEQLLQRLPAASAVDYALVSRPGRSTPSLP